jgi:hypothetical protein
VCGPPRSFKGCPSSTAKVKKHIEYLTPAEVSEAAREIRDLPLVRYRYKTQGDGVTPTVGIIIEDVPRASFVRPRSRPSRRRSSEPAPAASRSVSGARQRPHELRLPLDPYLPVELS